MSAVVSSDSHERHDEEPLPRQEHAEKVFRAIFLSRNHVSPHLNGWEPDIDAEAAHRFDRAITETRSAAGSDCRNRGCTCRYTDVRAAR